MRRLPGILFLAFLACAGGLVSCGLRPGLVGEPEFEGRAAKMEVSGVYGWWFATRVAYGPFHTGKFNRHSISTESGHEESTGWHWSFSDQEDEYRNMKNAFAFDQYDSLGGVAHVRTRAFRSSRVSHLGKTLEMEEVDSSRYEITIAQDSSQQTFSFPEDSAAYFKAGADSVKAEQVLRWDKGSKRVFQGVLFSVSGKTVAAVYRRGSGIVWLAQGLPDGERLTLAAAATAVLMKPKLGSEQD